MRVRFSTRRSWPHAPPDMLRTFGPICRRIVITPCPRTRVDEIILHGVNNWESWVQPGTFVRLLALQTSFSPVLPHHELNATCVRVVSVTTLSAPSGREERTIRLLYDDRDRMLFGRLELRPSYDPRL